MKRRTFLTALPAFIAAPALIRASSLEYVPRPKRLVFDASLHKTEFLEPYKIYAFTVLPDGTQKKCVHTITNHGGTIFIGNIEKDNLVTFASCNP